MSVQWGKGVEHSDAEVCYLNVLPQKSFAAMSSRAPS